MYVGLGQSSETGYAVDQIPTDDGPNLESLANLYNDAANSIRASGGSHVVVQSITDLGPYGGSELINVRFSDGTGGQKLLSDFVDEIRGMEQNTEMIAANTPAQQAALQQAGVVALPPIIVTPIIVPLPVSAPTPAPDLVSVASPASVASGVDQLPASATPPGPTNVPDSYGQTFAEAQAEAQQGESPVFVWNGQYYNTATGAGGIGGSPVTQGAGSNWLLIGAIAVGAWILLGGRK
jgi:hypothetical protein